MPLDVKVFMSFQLKKPKINFDSLTDMFSPRRKVLFIGFALFITLTFSVVNFAQEDDEDQVDVVSIFNQGQDAHEKGDLKTALKFYDQALKIAPEFPEAEYQRGNVLLSLGKPDEAEKSFRRAIELREDWTLPMASLGSILVSTNQFTEAEKILTKAVELDDKNFPAYVALTDLRLKSKASPEVLKGLLVSIQLLTSKANPTASIWASQSALERALGNKAAAKTSLSRSLAIEPKNKTALIEQVEIAISEGDFTIALETAKTLAQISPNAADIKLLQARIYAETGKTDETIKILDSIPNSAEVLTLRNSITAISSTSVSDLEKQLEKDSKNATILGRLCNLLRRENPPKALDYCRRASEAEPTNLNHAVGFGAALVQAKQYENAVALLKKILQIAPDNFTARANLAIALFQLKRLPEAKIEYQRLVEIKPDLPGAYFFLAIIHDTLGEYLDAMANYQQFLKIADSNEFKLEIEKVNLRLPILQKQIKDKKGKVK